MATLTKADLVQALSEEIGLNKREGKDLIDQFFEVIRANLETGHQVKISGFGNFTLRDKKERPGRNPKTGQVVPVKARRVVVFKASRSLKDLVEKYKTENK